MASQDASSVRSSTSQSAVKNRVPTKVLAGLGVRRTSQEVKAANQAAAAAAETAREKAQACHELIQQRMGELEDELQHEDMRRKKMVARPDLHANTATNSTPAATDTGKATKKQEGPNATKLKIVIKPVLASAKAAGNAEESANDFLTTNGTASVGSNAPATRSDVDLPGVGASAGRGDAGEGERSESPTPAPMGDALTFDNKFEDGYDHEDDLDYEQNEEDDDEEADESASDGNCQKGRKPLKSRPTKGVKGVLYRAEVNARRKTSSTSAISRAVENQLLKRKQRADDNVNNGAATKHREHPKRSSKAKVFASRGSKPETSVRILEPTASTLPIAITRQKFKKEQCKKSNLPFPAAHANRCRELWDQRFKSTLIAWNATLCQPFSSGTLLSTEVKSVWEKVFGDLAPLDEDDERWCIVETMAGDFLLNWRSEIGKTAITVTVAIFRSELMDKIEANKGDEAGVEAARYLLEDHRFVYGNPDAEDGESAQPFESPFVLQTFSFHLRQVIYVAKDYKISGNAIGALGLCAAAVERALTLIRDGHISINQWPPVLLPPVQAVVADDFKLKGPGSGKRRKATFTPFSESAWGSQTRSFAGTAAHLPEERWDSITEGAITDDIQQIIDTLGDSDDEDVSTTSTRVNKDSRANLRM
ncbi:hypothetical protein H1R20_g11326, partial [Candolleomyces eurysporus]